MPESEIENCIDGYEGEFASVFESAGRSVERARAELAELRAKAARQSDAELIVRGINARRISIEEYGGSETCELYLWQEDGPDIDIALPLTDTARAAIVQALERREG